MRGHIPVLALVGALTSAGVPVPYGQAAAMPADPIEEAVAQGDFDRAIVLARLERSPEKRCAVLLRKAASLTAREPQQARATLERLLQFVDRHRGVPRIRDRLAGIQQDARRRLARMDLAEAQDAEGVISAVEALLPMLPRAAQGMTLVTTAIRLDGLGARERAVAYFERAGGVLDDAAIRRAAALAGRLLDDGLAVASAEVETLLSELAAGQHGPLVEYILARAAERAWRSTEPGEAAVMQDLLAGYSARLPANGRTTSPPRLTAHRVALARRTGETVHPDVLAELIVAHGWLRVHGMPRDAADAAAAVASLTPPGPDRTEWLDKAAELYTSLDSLDAATSAAGLARVAALRPVESDTLASQFEGGQAGPDPLIESTGAFYQRVRAAYELRVSAAFDRGAFDEAFQAAQRAKLVELGSGQPRYETLGFDALAARYSLDPGDLHGPTVDLIIEYLVGNSATYVFGLRADERRQRFEQFHARIPLDRSAVTARVLRFLAAPHEEGHGRDLSDTFFEGAWGNWTRPWIVVAPDGPLRMLPFGLLPVPGGAPGETILRRITSDRAAIHAHLERRGALLTGPRPAPRRVDQARRLGLWPEVAGRLGYLPSAAILGNEPLAGRETTLLLWERSAARLRAAVKSGHPLHERLSISSPVSLNLTTARGLVLSLWSDIDGSATDSPSGRYLRDVFSLPLSDFGVNNKEGSILSQLQRDLSGGFRVAKEGRNARDIDVDAAGTAHDWGRWVYVDLFPVKRPR